MTSDVIATLFGKGLGCVISINSFSIFRNDLLLYLCSFVFIFRFALQKNMSSSARRVLHRYDPFALLEWQLPLLLAENRLLRKASLLAT
mmetsp:Transcript_6733/g.11574  ORF Transcript_6733/g.11574 Transcript_6733/m.11574 type:complete len:89 (-) Transcript_6733:522-788(-)